MRAGRQLVLLYGLADMPGSIAFANFFCELAD